VESNRRLGKFARLSKSQDKKFEDPSPAWNGAVFQISSKSLASVAAAGLLSLPPCTSRLYPVPHRTREGRSCGWERKMRHDIRDMRVAAETTH